MVRCFICSLDSDRFGHKQSSCVMRKFDCRRMLPRGHEFGLPVARSWCGNARCICRHERCSECDRLGHDVDSLALNPERYKLSPAGNGTSILRKTCTNVLKGDDFAFVNVDDVKAAKMGEGIRDGYEAWYISRQLKASSVGVRSGNLFAVGHSSADTINQIVQFEIKSSTLHKDNKRAHELATRGRKAGMSATEAALAAPKQIRRGTGGGQATTPAASSVGSPSSLQALAWSARQSKRHRADALAVELRGKTQAPRASTRPLDRIEIAEEDNLRGWEAGKRAQFAVTLSTVPFTSSVAWPSRLVAEHALATVFGDDFARTHAQLTGLVVNSACDSHLTGYALLCGACSAADIAVLPISADPDKIENDSRLTNEMPQRMNL